MSTKVLETVGGGGTPWLLRHPAREKKKGLSKKKWAALIILNLQENSNLLKFKYEQRRKR